MINERLVELINVVSKGNKRAFSKLVGVTPTVIENIVGKRKGKPGYDLLEKIAFSIENINLDWLLTGEGEILKRNMGDTQNFDLLVKKIEEKEVKIEKLQQKIDKLNEEKGFLKGRIRELMGNKNCAQREEELEVEDASDSSMVG